MNLQCEHESGGIINYACIEQQEQIDARAFLLPDDVVLELGGRWGGVSIIINRQLKDQTQHVVVEPDKRVWNVLDKNKSTHGCKFEIVKGAISNKNLTLDISDTKYHGLASFTETNDNGDVPIYPLSDFDYNFNVLVADCEGFLETFYDENKELFKNLRLILFEKDRTDFCDYERLKNEFKELGFIEYRDNGEHCVFIRFNQ